MSSKEQGFDADTIRWRGRPKRPRGTRTFQTPSDRATLVVLFSTSDGGAMRTAHKQ
jgi:hypothetical protein